MHKNNACWVWIKPTCTQNRVSPSGWGPQPQSVMTDRDQRNKSCSSRDTGVAKDMPQPCSLHAVVICATHGALHLSLKVLFGLASGSKTTKSRATGALLSPKTCQGEPGSAPALLSPHLSLPGHPWCWALQPQPEPALGVRCQRHKTLTCRDTGVAKDVSGAVWPGSNTAPSSLLSPGSPVVLYPVLYMESQCSGPCLVPHPSSSFTLKHCEVLVH